MTIRQCKFCEYRDGRPIRMGNDDNPWWRICTGKAGYIGNEPFFPCPMFRSGGLSPEAAIDILEEQNV